MIGNLPLEVCETVNNNWGFHKTDTNFKSTRQLIHCLIRAAGYGANFLLDIGPMPNGKIQPEFVTRLQEMGEWLDKNGSTLYGTRKGPFQPRPWGASTRKGDIIYIHLLEYKAGDCLWIPITQEIAQINYFSNGNRVDFDRMNDGILLKSLTLIASR